jgi:hypothetical protein
MRVSMFFIILWGIIIVGPFLVVWTYNDLPVGWFRTGVKQGKQKQGSNLLLTQVGEFDKPLPCPVPYG